MTPLFSFALALCLVGSAAGQHPVSPSPAAPAHPVEVPAPGPAAVTPPAATPPGPQGAQGKPQDKKGDDHELGELPEFTPIAAPPLSGLQGKQYFWFGLYPDFLAQYDPVTDAVVRKVKLQKGMFWNLTLTQDRRHMLVVTDQQHSIEVVDLQKGESVALHPFQEENWILRIRDVRELPGGVHWLVRMDRVKTEVDRYSFEAPQWLLYDSAQKKVLKKVARLPEALDRAQLLPDGATWQGQDDDGNFLLLDGRKLTEIGRIDLRTPRFFGAGPIRLMGNDLLDRRDPNRLRMLFSSSDPVEKSRSSWGVVELDLQKKQVVDVQEFGPQANAWGLRIAPKKMIAAGMTGNYGMGSGNDTKSRLLLYDLRTGKKIAEAYEEFRPRRMLVAISPDADKVYVGVAGSDFEVFDQNLKRLKTVELDGEIYGRIFTIDG